MAAVTGEAAPVVWATAGGGRPHVSFQTDPVRYRHWRLVIDGPVATLALEHPAKVNFCKFTNETRNGIEDATTLLRADVPGGAERAPAATAAAARGVQQARRGVRRDRGHHGRVAAEREGVAATDGRVGEPAAAVMRARLWRVLKVPE
jgi:hypothetical protein